MKRLLGVIAVLLLSIMLALSFAACTNGQEGENGITPHIGGNGNWFIGTTDTGIKAGGKDGNNGTNGTDGVDGANGIDGVDGVDGTDGKNGLSAYQIYVHHYPDYEGDEIEWINDLVEGNLVRFIVTFDSNGGGEVASLNVRKGTLISEPVPPYKQNYVFDGWYSDEELSVQWDFETGAVTSNITLYARWATEGINFELINGGTEYAVTQSFNSIPADTDIVIPSKHNSKPVTAISERAFYYRYFITSISIPNTVTAIGELAFYNCGYLTSLTIPSSVATLGEDVFKGCIELTDITVAEDNAGFSSIDGVLFNKEKTTLIFYPANKAGAFYIIPDHVTAIERSAFLYCYNLTSVTISSSVTRVAIGAFLNLFALETVHVKGYAQEPSGWEYAWIDGHLPTLSVCWDCQCGE